MPFKLLNDRFECCKKSVEKKIQQNIISGFTHIIKHLKRARCGSAQGVLNEPHLA